jgi:bacillithiol biosynthesis deacetylase BshB1
MKDYDVLAFGTHPDDIELCCAGTLIKLNRMGYRTAIVDLTAGEMGTRGTAAIRRREAAAAAAIIGSPRENLGIPDGNIQITQANLKKVVTAIRRYRPKQILIPAERDRHPDHNHAHTLCREAWFYSGLSKLPTSYRGKRQEPFRPRNHFQYMLWQEFTPSFIVDISDVYDVKLSAIKAFTSQLYNPKSREPQTKLSEKVFFDLIETRSKSFGWRIGARHGEPFVSVEAIGIQNPLDLKLFGG